MALIEVGSDKKTGLKVEPRWKDGSESQMTRGGGSQKWW